MKMKTTVIIGILVFLAGAAFSIPALRHSGGSNIRPKSAVITHKVKTAEVEKARMSRQVRFSGVSRAVKRAKLSFTIGERMMERPVEVIGANLRLAICIDV